MSKQNCEQKAALFDDLKTAVSDFKKLEITRGNREVLGTLRDRIDDLQKELLVGLEIFNAEKLRRAYGYDESSFYENDAPLSQILGTQYRIDAAFYSRIILQLAVAFAKGGCWIAHAGIERPGKADKGKSRLEFF